MEPDGVAETPPPPDVKPLEVALEDVAESLRVSAKTMADVMPSRSKARLIGKVLWVTAGSAILTFVVVIVVLVTLFGVSLPVQHSIQRATSPQSQQAASGATAAAESHIITCEENHMNRLFERALHMRIDPTDGGCPADSLP